MGRSVSLGTDVDDPEPLAQQVRRTVARRTGFTCCVGIGDNKLRAKMATGFAKAPSGLTAGGCARGLPAHKGELAGVMGDRPTDALWGVGTKTSAKLTELGISTVRELAAADLDAMRARFGPRTGPWLVVARTRYRRPDA